MSNLSFRTILTNIKYFQVFLLVIKSLPRSLFYRFLLGLL